jgi:membrane protein implicated in regulation of membrane protease activity
MNSAQARSRWLWVVLGGVLLMVIVGGGVLYLLILPDKALVIIGTPGPVTPPPSP